MRLPVHTAYGEARLTGWSVRISQHQYSAAFCSGSDFDLISFMNKTSIRGNLTVFEEDVAATHANGLDYILAPGAGQRLNIDGRRTLTYLTCSETNSIAYEGAE